MLLVLIVLTAAGVALLATGFVVALVAATLAAVFAMFLAAGVPDRVSQHIENLDRRNGVIALDHELTTSRTLLGSSVLNNEGETRARTQRRRFRGYPCADYRP